MSLAGCQINLIDINFHLQNLEFFDKSSAVKIWSKNDMPIRVKQKQTIATPLQNMA